MLTPGGATVSNADFHRLSMETKRPKPCGDHRNPVWVQILGVIPAQNKNIITKQTP